MIYSWKVFAQALISLALLTDLWSRATNFDMQHLHFKSFYSKNIQITVQLHLLLHLHCTARHLPVFPYYQNWNSHPGYSFLTVQWPRRWVPVLSKCSVSIAFVIYICFPQVYLKIILTNCRYILQKHFSNAFFYFSWDTVYSVLSNTA